MISKPNAPDRGGLTKLSAWIEALVLGGGASIIFRIGWFILYNKLILAIWGWFMVGFIILLITLHAFTHLPGDVFVEIMKTSGANKQN